MKKKLLLFINFIICFFVYSEELMEKQQELREQIVKNYTENTNDINLIIEYAKLFLPENFHYDDNKIKTPTLSENNYSWKIDFVLKNEYITEDLYKDDIAIIGYTIRIRKVTGEAVIDGWIEVIHNIYRIQYGNFLKKISQFDSLIKDTKNYKLFHEYHKKMNNLIFLRNSITENNIANYVNYESNEKLKIQIYNPEKIIKEAYDKHVISSITYYKNEEELLCTYLLNDENYDLLISINDASERKISKYLISKTTNEFQEEIINY